MIKIETNLAPFPHTQKEKKKKKKKGVIFSLFTKLSRLDEINKRKNLSSLINYNLLKLFHALSVGDSSKRVFRCLFFISSNLIPIDGPHHTRHMGDGFFALT